MHPKVVQAIQEIDAAVYSGDTFEDPEARAELLIYAQAWVRKLTAAIEAEAKEKA